MQCAEASPAEQNWRFHYLPFLDGCRALAILLVLCFHDMGPVSSRIGRLFSGWVGVDMFFVISGFLITSLLVQEQLDTGRLSLKRFYVRRSLRIWPVYYVFIAFCALLGLTTFTSSVISAFYLVDFDSVFGWNGVGMYHQHLWSLAIEEQFYLLWPLTLFFVGKRATRVTVAVIGAVWVWRTYLLLDGVPWTRIGSFDTRIDCILIGCLAALLWADPKWRERIRAGLQGAWTPALIGIGLFFAAQTLGHPSNHGSTRFLLWTARLPLFHILFAAFILSLLVQPTSALTRFLSYPVLTWVGRLSYSLYLWHLLVFHGIAFIIASNPLLGRVPDVVLEVVRLVLAVAVAAFSYYLIEKPFLRLKKRWQSVPLHDAVVSPRREPASAPYATAVRPTGIAAPALVGLPTQE